MGDDSSSDRDPRAPSPSARVRLEVELLASEQPVDVPEPVVGDRPQPHTVLVAIADADVRQYVRECLRDRVDLRVFEAPTVAIAEHLAELQPPRILIVERRDLAGLSAIEHARVVVIADDVSPDAVPNDRLVTLLRPFGAQDLEAIVDRLL